MGKIPEIKIVRQAIFKQIMIFVSKIDIQGLIKKHESDYNYKSFKTRTYLFIVLFGILSRFDSMTKKCEGLRPNGYAVKEVKRVHNCKKDEAKVLKNEILEREYHPERENGKQDLNTKLKMKLRKVRYWYDQNRYFDFLTNNFEIEVEDVSFQYKKR